MVETPAAALAIPALLRHVDFLCVGTNDLTQYTLAAARDDAAVNDYYLDSHESVLRLLSIILADAKQRSVTLGGELAGRELWVPRLVQMFSHVEYGAHNHSDDEGDDSRCGHGCAGHHRNLTSDPASSLRSPAIKRSNPSWRESCAFTRSAVPSPADRGNRDPTSWDERLSKDRGGSRMVSVMLPFATIPARSQVVPR
jgi:hypothetical protein